MVSKRIRVFAVHIFTGLSILMAQPAKFQAGLKAGLSLPDLTSGAESTPLSEGYTTRVGFYGGIVAQINTTDKFGYRAEINFSSQGGKRSGMQALPLYPVLQPLWDALPSLGIPHDEYMYADITTEVVLNYLELPLMARYRFSIARDVIFYLQAGPYVGILLNAKYNTSGTSGIFINMEGTISVDDVLKQAGIPPVGPQSYEHTEDLTSEIHRFNAGGQGILGIGIRLGNGELFIEGGGSYGFIPIQKDDANGTNNTGAGTVTVGYLLDL